MRLEPGQRLGAYEIIGSLGAGGMGNVYRARDTRLGRLSDHDAFLTVPHDPFEGGPIRGEKIPPKSRSSQKTPKDALIAVEYEVKVDGKKASGNSDPVIIIDP